MQYCHLHKYCNVRRLDANVVFHPETVYQHVQRTVPEKDEQIIPAIHILLIV